MSLLLLMVIGKTIFEQKDVNKDGQTCPFSIFVDIPVIEDAKNITGNFKCAFCPSEKYSSEGVDKQLPLHENSYTIDLLSKFEEMLPVTCDKYPKS